MEIFEEFIEYDHQDPQIGTISILATGFLVLTLFQLLFQCQFLQI